MNYFTIIFALGISAVAFWFSIKFIRLYFKVKRWNRVNATILSKQLFLHPKISSSRSPYGIKVNYTYHVDNSTYSGNKVYLVELAGGQTNQMKSTAENKLNKIEDIMSIYVNPNDLTKSVMYCEGIGLYILVFFIGLLSLLIGISNIL
jgi:hypothetical protein